MFSMMNRFARTAQRCSEVLLMCGILLFNTILSADVTAAKNQPHPGQALIDALDYYRSAGYPLVYSTALITSAMTVKQAPQANSLIDQVAELLAPHQLELRPLDGLMLVVRQPLPVTDDPPAAMILLLVERNGIIPDASQMTVVSDPPLGSPQVLAGGVLQFSGVAPGSYELTTSSPGYHPAVNQVAISGSEIELIKLNLRLAPAQLEELNISASRYVLRTNSQFYIDQSAIQALPDLGEDPIRSAQRLPGSAAGGLSARSHFRGGETDETAIYFNGVKLTDPFHIRDYHNIFSSIDARAIAGVEAFTGGFPARYGDQMSGVLLLESQRPDQPRHTEIGLSIYNTSLLASGFSQDGRWEWLGSARRSNLSVLLDSSVGKPDYFDLFGELAVYLTPQTRLSFNTLYADDQVLVITESDPAELEQSISNTQNIHSWLRLQNQWSSLLSSDTSLWINSLENSRLAEVNDPEQMVADVSDKREIQSFGLSQNWAFDGISEHHLRWGFEWSHDDASYDYKSAVEYFGFAANWPDINNPRQTDIVANPAGNRFGIFAADHWQLTADTALNFGLRWDGQNYTEPHYQSQLSPRISAMHQLTPATELRFTWGRYYQSQGIQRLQVEDGLSDFFAPQRADHLILGFRFNTDNHYRFRLELFQKNYSRLKPRFENLFDSLALIPELEPDRVRLDPSSARARGLEFSVEYSGESAFEWWANYSLARATDRIAGQQQNRSWDQRHAIQAGLAWRHELWELGLALNWHSGWPTTGMQLGADSDEDEYFPIPGPRNAENLGHYSTLDFRISREFELSKGSLSAFFEVSNAMNRKNPCCIDFDTDEDAAGNVFLDRTVDDWLPLLPAVGLLWEF